MLTIIHVSHEPIQLLDECLNWFRKSYPTSPVVCIGDGVCGDYPRVAAHHRAEWISGQQLKRFYRYPLWTDRLFQIALERKNDWYLLLDPDTKIWRPFTNFPNADVCGSLIKGTTNGCASLYRRSLVEKYPLISRDVWHELPGECQQHMFTIQAYQHDQWMPFILKRLNATIAETNEVGAVIGGPAPDNSQLKFAATHPHKSVASWLNPQSTFNEGDQRAINFLTQTG